MTLIHAQNSIFVLQKFHPMACLYALLGMLLLMQGARAASPPRHVVFILVDDMGRGDAGCYGGGQAPTPNIDRLAREGIRFEQFYTAAPICSPARAGFLTGSWPARWRIASALQSRDRNRLIGQADYLSPAAPSLGKMMQGAGYATAHIGKWHLGGGRDVVDAPGFAAYGFDEHVGTWQSPDPHPAITATDWIWSTRDPVKRWERTAFFVDRALDFLARHRDRPAFVQLWFDDVHTPWIPDAETPTNERPQDPTDDVPRYFRPVLAEMDRQIGRLLDGIRALGLEQETLIVFASDNGPIPTFSGARAGGFRGSKYSLYEGGIRMPFIVHWPGHVPAGRTDRTTVLAAVDLLPTLATLVNGTASAGGPTDGEDLSPALFGSPVKRRGPLFWEYGRSPAGFRFPSGRDRSPVLAMREGDWKLLINADGSGAELYRLEDDAGEAWNLAAAQPEVVQRLAASALAWRRAMP